MYHFGKNIILAIILVQLIALPIIVIASKTQQETRSNAAQETQANADNISEGNAVLSIGKDFSSEPVLTQPQSISTTARITTTPSNSGVKKDVYAYLPYWEVDSDTDTYLQYKYMTHLIYHGISLGKNGVINKTNGPWNTWKSDRMTKIVQNARTSGVKVLPNIVLFNSSGNKNLNDFLDNSSSRDKAIIQIMDFLKTSPQPVDGVAIDFEYPGTTQKEELLDFMKKLRTEMKEYDSNWTLTIAVDGYSYNGGGFDLPKLSNEIDSFFIMSYHLRNPRTAEKAGSTNPISSISNLADKYLEKVPANKIVLGFPLYLSEWKTMDNSLHAPKKPDTGGGKTTPENECGLSGSTCTRLAQRYAKTYGKKYDTRDKAAYYSFYVCDGNAKNKGWRQVYFDDEQAFTAKFGLINNKNLKGIGFWAQNYDKGYLDTWNAIYNAFGDKSILSAPIKKSGFIIPAPITTNGCIAPTSTPINTPTTSPTPNVTITPKPSPTLSPAPTKTPGPTMKPSPSPTKKNTATPKPSLSPTPAGAVLKFPSIKLHGIGNGGDNSNPKSQGNFNPRTKTKTLTVEIYNTSEKPQLTTQGEIKYNPTTRDFSGDVFINSSLNSGSYLIKIKTDKYLKKQLTGIITLNKNKINQAPSVVLITGDSNNDGSLSILDYNLTLDCYSVLKSPKNCDSTKKNKTDLSDDGKVNQDDYNLLLREISVLQGD